MTGEVQPELMDLSNAEFSETAAEAIRPAACTRWWTTRASAPPTAPRSSASYAITPAGTAVVDLIGSGVRAIWDVVERRIDRFCSLRKAWL